MKHFLHRFATKTVSAVAALLPHSFGRFQRFVDVVIEAGVLHFNRHSSLAAVKKCACFALCLVFASLLICGSHMTEFADPLLNQFLGGRPVVSSSCASPRVNEGQKGLPTPSPTSHQTSARLRLDPRALLFVDSPYSRTGRDIAMWLVANRIRYKSEVIGKSLPVLTYEDKGKFGVVIFENIMRYLNMDSWHRRILDRYMSEYHVGLIGFLPSSSEELDPSAKLLQLGDFPLFYQSLDHIKDVHLNPASQVLRLTRAGDYARGDEGDGWGGPWFGFWLNHSSYTPLEFAFTSRDDPEKSQSAAFPMHSKFASVGTNVFKNNSTSGRLVTVVQDSGAVDGIDRVLFGAPLNFWLHKLVFLDALSYLSRGRLSVPLTRYIQVDIDDIFVGRQGIRLTRDDVVELLAAQDRLRRTVDGFRYNLGFSGYYFHHGSPSEDEGDDMLIANAPEFWWFPHMWNHQQPHNFSNITQLMELMRLNRNFAEEHKLPVDNFYSIAPHHSGVYPVHEELYEAWKEVWQVRVTATEEYPHLKPPRLRRGFVYGGIQVLPRQTCGLYTTNLFYESYPGGKARLESSIRGGELFQTIVANQFSVFMTHMSNYGNDRLGLYTFESVFGFLRCWTNLEFKTVTPLEMAERYFKVHPDEKDPVWESPCHDKRHREIWSPLKTCSRLPNLLVLGPQKTGTTALYSFLSMHPSVASNQPSPETFEEVQFFSGKNYLRGLDWYMNFFPDSVGNDSSATQLYLFEKSANYFDGELVPRRAHALVPKADLVVILISPAKRAHSWYHHQRAHDDPTALKYSFYEVISAKDTTNRKLKELRNRCLYPGLYAHHLDRWLSYYPPQQLHIVDGEALKLNPVVVMNSLQKELNITPFYDYANRLSYDAKKGFYCQLDGKKTKCLGKSKGRKYSPMDEKSAAFLKRYYLSSNVSLEKLLKRLGYAIPVWLKDDLSEVPSETNRVSPEG